MDLKTGLHRALILLLFASPVKADETSLSKYMDTVREELARLQVEVHCQKGKGHCTVETSGITEKIKAPLEIVLKKKSHTIYLFFDGFMPIDTEDMNNSSLLKKALELNSEMIAPRLELHSEKPFLRLSAVLNIDSNFDRKAFRSTVLSLISTAEKIKSILEETKKRAKADP